MSTARQGTGLGHHVIAGDDWVGRTMVHAHTVHTWCMARALNVLRHAPWYTSVTIRGALIPWWCHDTMMYTPSSTRGCQIRPFIPSQVWQFSEVGGGAGGAVFKV